MRSRYYSAIQVEPTDDGTWGGDMMLTAEQAQRIITQQEAMVGQELVATPPPLPTLDDAKRRRKRYALYMEENAAAYWDVMPIKYVIENTFSKCQTMMPNLTRECTIR